MTATASATTVIQATSRENQRLKELKRNKKSKGKNEAGKPQMVGPSGYQEPDKK